MTDNATQQVWFITGSSRGFGRALAESALEAGHLVAATARRPEQLDDLVAQYGDRVAALALDVTDSAAAQAAIAAATSRFGRLDVVVNNAGYANLAPIETGDEADFRTQFDTNFWGVYNVSRAATAVLRTQGAGLIVQFSSIGGRVGGQPGLGSYQAAKFAVDGFTRVLAAEVAPFGVKTMVVEPSGFATDWAGSSMTIPAVPEAYLPTVGAISAHLGGGARPAGDPGRGARIIIEAAQRVNPPAHLLIGADAAEMALAYTKGQIAEADAWAAVSRSADFDQPFPAVFPADGAGV
jgi:NAD(P)-dependent dehydrogenase (short-subunit alcohol dehydrogenase family)